MISQRLFSFESSIDTNYAESSTHYHNTIEIYFLLEGSCWYFIDKNSYLLHAGDIAIIPCGVIHRTSYESARHSRLLISCDRSLIPDSLRDRLSAFPCFPKSDKTAPKIRSLWNEIELEYRKDDEYSFDIIKAKLAELLLTIARESSESNPQKNKSAIVEKAVRYIQTNYVDGVTLEDTAKHCFVSTEHLSRTFKKETGFGFCEYLNVYRLKKADSLLSGGQKQKISEIAAACGFQDSNYFSKVYKQMYGIPPRERKRQQQFF